MKRETSIYGMFFAGFFFLVYQSSKVKNCFVLPTQCFIEFWI